MQQLKIWGFFAQQQIKCILGRNIAKANISVGVAVVRRRKGKLSPPEYLFLGQVLGQALYRDYLT